ncbi:hypothetical protein [Altericista sp. CCNU0014]
MLRWCGSVAADFVIIISLSAAEAATHIADNPLTFSLDSRDFDDEAQTQ